MNLMLVSRRQQVLCRFGHPYPTNNGGKPGTVAHHPRRFVEPSLSASVQDLSTTTTALSVALSHGKCLRSARHVYATSSDFSGFGEDK